MAEGKWIATTNLDWSCCVNRIPCFNRRFSAGFGSRDYRTSTSGSGGSTRPGGSVGGPRTSGGGSYPNYSAPPPTHGTKQKKETKLLGYTFGSNPSVFFVTFRCCCLLHASLFLLLMRPVRKQQKKKSPKPFHHPLIFSYLYWVLWRVLYISLTVWSGKIFSGFRAFILFRNALHPLIFDVACTRWEPLYEGSLPPTPIML